MTDKDDFNIIDYLEEDKSRSNALHIKDNGNCH